MRTGPLPGQHSLPGWMMHLFVLLGVLLLRGYLFPSANHATEIPPILAMLDPGLYASDYFVQEMLRFTPRTYYAYLVYALAQTGLGITAAYVVLFVGALAAFLLGLRALARALALTRLGTALLVFWALSVTAGIIGGNPASTLWPSAPIPTAYAMGVVVWGVVYSVRRAWVPAYALFGAACLMQFLVGLLPALLVTPLAARDAWQRGRWRSVGVGLLLLAAGAGLVYVPMLLQGTTGTALLSDRAFVEIYAYLRHPHHLVPSAWPSLAWMQMTTFYVGGLLCVFRTRAVPASCKVALPVVVGLAALGLVINMLFVEVWPLAAVAKLQPARLTPYAQLAVLMGLAVVFREHLKRGHTAVCLVLAVAPVAHYPGLVLLVLALGMRALEGLRLNLRSKVGLTLAVALLAGLYRFPMASNPVVWMQALVEGPLLAGVVFTPYLLHRWVPQPRMRLTVAAVLVGLAAGALAAGLSGALPERLDALVAKKITVTGVWRDDVAVLARRFGDETAGDVLVLTPPSVQHFRLYARQSVVADFKAFPYTDSGIREWKARMDALEGYCARSPAYLVAVARRYGAAYILSREACHAAFPGEKVDQEGDWALWSVDEAAR